MSSDDFLSCIGSGLPFAMVQEPGDHSGDDESSLSSSHSETSPPSSSGGVLFDLTFTLLDVSSSTDVPRTNVFSDGFVSEPDEMNTHSVVPATMSVGIEVDDQFWHGRTGRDVDGLVVGGHYGGADVGHVPMNQIHASSLKSLLQHECSVHGRMYCGQLGIASFIR
ncbi:uncharacterized protein BT62DRAFT_797859 [Guyanagaster necrorhizus]|uniref:Uncharacterized protein n=1 Tax=Guyanagaster necrorhizus TaxID=856835 RepID=A0A9P7VFQ1_9AGAR|nr:uncharacterized protein BT62DRAFT_797859 [Guyanagaster necrorhizus MCA 3950]KAG7439154.1 hypothetical protein BT62DRAFT_797859 [Guyanagaster necrorhizus MCA 3950]